MSGTQYVTLMEKLEHPDRLDFGLRQTLLPMPLGERIEYLVRTVKAISADSFISTGHDISNEFIKKVDESTKYYVKALFEAIDDATFFTNDLVQKSDGKYNLHGHFFQSGMQKEIDAAKQAAEKCKAQYALELYTQLTVYLSARTYVGGGHWMKNNKIRYHMETRQLLLETIAKRWVEADNEIDAENAINFLVSHMTDHPYADIAAEVFVANVGGKMTRIRQAMQIVWNTSEKVRHGGWDTHLKKAYAALAQAWHDYLITYHPDILLNVVNIDAAMVTEQNYSFVDRKNEQPHWQTLISSATKLGNANRVAQAILAQLNKDLSLHGMCHIEEINPEEECVRIVVNLDREPASNLREVNMLLHEKASPWVNLHPEVKVFIILRVKLDDGIYSTKYHQQVVASSPRMVTP
jgi:hypothetical protein